MNAGAREPTTGCVVSCSADDEPVRQPAGKILAPALEPALAPDTNIYVYYIELGVVGGLQPKKHTLYVFQNLPLAGRLLVRLCECNMV